MIVEESRVTFLCSKQVVLWHHSGGV
jgi:hypothetical protein